MTRHYDSRGFFQEICRISKNEYKQVNCSFSVKNTLRGIHVADYHKLVTCVSGRIFDVVIDMKNLSFKTYSLEAGQQVYVPKNHGHAFLALEDSIVVYLTGEVYSFGREKVIRYDCPKIGIPWQGSDFILSEKDDKAGWV